MRDEKPDGYPSGDAKLRDRAGECRTPILGGPWVLEVVIARHHCTAIRGSRWWRPCRVIHNGGGKPRHAVGVPGR